MPCGTSWWQQKNKQSLWLGTSSPLNWCGYRMNIWIPGRLVLPYTVLMYITEDHLGVFLTNYRLVEDVPSMSSIAGITPRILTWWWQWPGKISWMFPMCWPVADNQLSSLWRAVIPIAGSVVPWGIFPNWKRSWNKQQLLQQQPED